MKAFKSIEFKKENKFFWTYSGILTVLSFMILLSPVFAQDDASGFPEPEVKFDVNKEYDEQGNLVRIDSSVVKSFYSSMDSGMISPGEYFNRNNLGFPGNHLHPFWEWNPEDSTAVSNFDDLFGFDFFSPPTLYYHKYSDSLPIDQDTIFGQMFQHHFDLNLQDHQQRIEEYFKEHQKLIERFFGEPYRDNSDFDSEMQSRIKI